MHQAVRKGQLDPLPQRSQMGKLRGAADFNYCPYCCTQHIFICSSSYLFYDTCLRFIITFFNNIVFKFEFIFSFLRM
ncbi:hypothetical protein ES332_D04G053600v1 [Gossypium tomentosum]|uniref:Uncharacterized protein n=1 Tax=Gossypium tomentosum TaxID=34277 RepID=A0A5D2LA13_GOSTO|nr:hypothetical protein ES332_D04G053600v1 [Gossypium tomentosum]